jgi:hypothetical protein
MNCDFEVLVSYLDRKLDVDRQLDLLDHLEFCEPCFDALYKIVRDRDENLFVGAPLLNPAE